jgi:hypothetical protein
MCWRHECKTHHDICEDLQQQQGDTGENKNGKESDNELEDISMPLNSRIRSDFLQTKLNIVCKMDFAKQQLYQLMTLVQVTMTAQGMNQQGQQRLPVQDGQQCARSILYNSDNIQCDINMIQSIYGALKEKESKVELEPHTLQNNLSHPSILHNSLKRSLDDYIKSKQFSADKLYVAERYRDAFCTMHNDGKLQCVHVPLTFISTGQQAGAGKTYLLNALSVMSKIISSVSKGALKLTHMGVAAAKCGGYTLYILGIPITLNACGIDTATQQAWRRALPIERAMELQDQYDFKEGHYRWLS